MVLNYKFNVTYVMLDFCFWKTSHSVSKSVVQ